ncbi:MAG: bifunctional UDP-N-acetylglucosamine diphosphorylase/glucosamine-1-phosphate N-acetyltransferase GlmU [Alphaproteobacteria bacterium]|nr:bifunctional UDP-N-acetylglucosamine diphosphorylase/glucosamine-1-phosphate N-acetyltransferase GlmU [Alphaproteobacteria bacterium]
MSNAHKHNFAAVILAAGQGTRMKSAMPKVMHKLAGQPLIAHVLASIAPLHPERTVVVIAPHMDSVRDTALKMSPACKVAIQDKQQGTGHAVLCAEEALAGYEDTVFVLYGDTPLISPRTLHHLQHAAMQAEVVVLGMELDNPTGYGRLVVDANGLLREIVEEKDANPQQKQITFCNSGVMAISGKHLVPMLKQLKNANAAGEYYLTDIIAIAGGMGLTCGAMEADPVELAGINSREQLAQAESVMQGWLRQHHMSEGATLIDPQTVYFSVDTQLGKDVVIHPNVVFGANVRVADNVEIRSFSHVEGASIETGATVGPFARLRPGTSIGENGHVGNFVELKNTKLGKGAKANHLSYVGDSEVGEGANIGAGTITCNYDGINKFKTIIGAGAFIGSNSSLVAPVTIGSGAIVGAGSVITQDVPDDALAVTRAEQKNIAGKGKELKARKKK